MTWRFAVELPEAPDVVERHSRLAESFVIGVHRLDTGQMQRRPEQHRSMPVGENEAITVVPNRVLLVEIHCAIPNRINQRCQGHWRARMSGLGGLHCIDREGADGVDGKLNHFVVIHAVFLSSSSEATLARRRRWRGALL